MDFIDPKLVDSGVAAAGLLSLHNISVWGGGSLPPLLKQILEETLYVIILGASSPLRLQCEDLWNIIYPQKLAVAKRVSREMSECRQVVIISALIFPLQEHRHNENSLHIPPVKASRPAAAAIKLYQMKDTSRKDFCSFLTYLTFTQPCKV
ncbi:Hypothetical protein SMAX5B_005675 [Scophthalmus maximus]|uniref:Uncharacterized protein n=1 Tax=Scophthalmus maximus TaxID=52904 RepID=A0A2U9BBT7_SCOMX|nr:Hypothetical protein SMAX5B_005675 [Scophthalmus maximus]